MKKAENVNIYKLTYLARFISVFFGGLNLFIFTFLLIDQIINNSNKINLLDEVILLILLVLLSLYGFFLIINPFITKLIITEDGYTYQSIGFILTATWPESIIKNELPFVFGRFGILYPYAPQRTFSNKFARLYFSNNKGGIPINYFGGFSSKKLKEGVYEKAPYLSGLLHTEGDFIKTINAIDFLISRCIERKISGNFFLRIFAQIYTHYFIDGGKYVYEYHYLRDKHRDKLSFHAAIWNEEIHSNIQNQNNSIEVRLLEIKSRYQRD